MYYNGCLFTKNPSQALSGKKEGGKARPDRHTRKGGKKQRARRGEGEDNRSQPEEGGQPGQVQNRGACTRK